VCAQKMTLFALPLSCWFSCCSSIHFARTSLSSSTCVLSSATVRSSLSNWPMDNYKKKCTRQIYLLFVSMYKNKKGYKTFTCLFVDHNAAIKRISTSFCICWFGNVCLNNTCTLKAQRPTFNGQNINGHIQPRF